MNTSRIKVVHISTSWKGGAGTAAYRIHRALLRSGVDSHFVSIDDNIPENTKSHTTLKRQRRFSFMRAVANKSKWLLKKYFNVFIDKKDFFINKLNEIYPQLKCEIATLPFSGYNVLEDPYVKNADIIHLHWVAGMLDYPSFFRNNKKPVIWIMHDMNPFQGLFHYKADEERNKFVLQGLDARVLAMKQRAISNRKHHLTVVCPSQWLLKKATESKAFKSTKSHCIRYTLDMKLFSPKRENCLRSTLNIPEENTLFLFISQSVENHRKGFDLLLKTLNDLNQLSITLLVIGSSENPGITGLDIRMLGTVCDDNLLSQYYSLADAFVIPSREDNLPNVMLESMACGTPVLSFDIGGMSEIIIDGFNGLKACKMESVELLKCIKEFIKTKEKYSAKAIRDFALETFSDNIIAEKYKEVYKSVLQGNA